MQHRYQFREGQAPVVIGERPEGWTWVDLSYSKLPPWQRLHAVLADGRVVMPAANAFKDDDTARRYVQGVGRPIASTERDGHWYAETLLAVTALRGLADEAIAQIEAIADVCRAAVAGEIEVIPLPKDDAAEIEAAPV
jgi:hypothetical protein